MRIKVNDLTNVLTGDDTTGYRHPGEAPRPQITIPHLRARLTVEEAGQLATALCEAIAVARHKDTRDTP
jgi:hypothetical protein